MEENWTRKKKKKKKSKPTTNRVKDAIYKTTSKLAPPMQIVDNYFTFANETVYNFKIKDNPDNLV